MKQLIDEGLLERVRTASRHEIFDVDLFLADEPARADAAHERVVSLLENESANVAFTDGAASHQGAEVIARSYSTNSIAVRVSAGVLRQLIDRDDVIAIQPVEHADIADLQDASAPAGPLPAGGPSIGWGVTQVKAPLLWARGIDGSGVVVAVIDNGVNYRHTDLAARMWRSPDQRFPNHGYDFFNRDDDPMDQDGHGTACAGIIAGDGTSGVRTGVAPGASIMAIRVGATERTFREGIEWAVDNGARVISMSLTWKYRRNPDYPGWRRLCAWLLGRGVLHANSIGNEGTQTALYPVPFNIGAPGNCPPPRLHPALPIAGGVSSSVACGATDASDALLGASGRGPAEWNAQPFADYPFRNGAKAGLIKPDLCAPGAGTPTCYWRDGAAPGAKPKPYTTFGATSGATAHVAGCMALLAHATLRKGLQPNPAQVVEALEQTAVRIPGQTRAKENHYGSGRADVYAAFLYGEKKGWWR
jgi:subtilisin family serine protease